MEYGRRRRGRTCRIWVDAEQQESLENQPEATIGVELDIGTQVAMELHWMTQYFER